MNRVVFIVVFVFQTEIVRRRRNYNINRTGWNFTQNFFTIAAYNFVSKFFNSVCLRNNNSIFLKFCATSRSFFRFSIFNFSFNLQSVPLSIIGVSYSLAAFPTLTRLFSAGNREQFILQMITSARHIIFWSVPITVSFIVLRAQIVRTILGAGRFNWEDTRLTAAALALFSCSLVAQSLIILFVRSYYSQGKTKTPLIMNVISAVIIITFSFFLVEFFQQNFFFRDFVESLLKVSGLPGTVVLMLPLGFTVGALLNLVIYWIAFSRNFPSFSPRVLRTFFQISGASVIMGFVTYKCLSIFDAVFNINTLPGIFFQGFVSGVVGIVVAALILYLLHNEELREVWETLHKKIWKAKVIVPDAELQ